MTSEIIGYIRLSLIVFSVSNGALFGILHLLTEDSVQTDIETYFKVQLAIFSIALLFLAIYGVGMGLYTVQEAFYYVAAIPFFT